VLSASDMPGSAYEEFLNANGGQFQAQPNGQLPNQQPDMQQRLAAQLVLYKNFIICVKLFKLSAAII